MLGLLWRTLHWFLSWLLDWTHSVEIGCAAAGIQSLAGRLRSYGLPIQLLAGMLLIVVNIVRKRPGLEKLDCAAGMLHHAGRGSDGTNLLLLEDAGWLHIVVLRLHVVNGRFRHSWDSGCGHSRCWNAWRVCSVGYCSCSYYLLLRPNGQYPVPAGFYFLEFGHLLYGVGSFDSSLFGVEQSLHVPPDGRIVNLLQPVPQEVVVDLSAIFGIQPVNVLEVGSFDHNHA